MAGRYGPLYDIDIGDRDAPVNGARPFTYSENYGSIEDLDFHSLNENQIKNTSCIGKSCSKIKKGLKKAIKKLKTLKKSMRKGGRKRKTRRKKKKRRTRKKRRKRKRSRK